MNLEDVKRIKALANDPHVKPTSSWNGFNLLTQNGWTRDYVAAVLAAAPELLEFARTRMKGDAKAIKLLDETYDSYSQIHETDANDPNDAMLLMNLRFTEQIHVVAAMTGRTPFEVHQDCEQRLIERIAERAARNCQGG